jgi:RNA polymerase sigma-70 factor (ECF subfamily)
VLELARTLARVFEATPSRLLGYGQINGLPGFVTIENGDVLQTTALLLENERIAAIYVMRNPDKLGDIRRRFPNEATGTRRN